MGLRMSKTASLLLNDESKKKARNIREIQYLRRGQIRKNPKNNVSINGIEELAQDIRMCGIEQPLVGYVLESGDYMLLTGERRLTAVDKLIEDGIWDPENDLIPFIVVSLEDYDLPIDNDLKERYAILRTNAFNRVLTDADKVVQAADYTAIVKSLKKNGYKEMIIGYDEQGEPVAKSISGRTREVVADMMGISTGQMSKIESIEKHGGDKLKQAVRSGDMSIAAASALSQYPEEKQDEFLNNEDLPSATASSINSAMEDIKWKEMDLDTAKEIVSNLLSQNEMEMIRVIFSNHTVEITESECKERINAKYGYRGFDVYKSDTSSQSVEFYPLCIIVKQEIDDKSWRMDIHEKANMDWSKFLKIVLEDDATTEYFNDMKNPSEDEIRAAWLHFCDDCKGMTANEAAAFNRKNHSNMGYYGDIKLECSYRGISINEKEEITWLSFCLQAMALDDGDLDISDKKDDSLVRPDYLEQYKILGQALNENDKDEAIRICNVLLGMLKKE